MIRSNKEKYWRDRAKRYSGFQWANNTLYLRTFIGACDFKLTDWVLDVGCGPGIVSKKVAHIAHRVIGLDNSREMLSQCDGDFNLMFGDVREIPFPARTFDKVLARNVFHHVTDDLKKALQECHRVLKPGGKLIIGERVPPSNSRQVHFEYREMLALKDKRHTFTEDNLNYFLIGTGFDPGPPIPVWIPGLDVRKWIEQTGLDELTRMELWNRHVNGSKEFKEASRMKEVDGGCEIEIKNLIMVGVKR